jgi:hypothetical protein
MLDDWKPFTKLGLYGMLMLCMEWWAFEICVLLAGWFRNVTRYNATQNGEMQEFLAQLISLLRESSSM